MAEPNRGPFYDPSAFIFNAERQQRFAEQIFGPDTLLGNRERRTKLLAGEEEAAERTAAVVAIQRVVPNPLVRAAAGFLAGTEFDPATGKIRPGTGFPGNALPAPIGFAPAKSFGLSPNFYLPPRVTEVIPSEADRVGFGLPEQRREDEANAEARRIAAATTQIRGARAVVATESDETLAALIAGQGGLSRAGVVRASNPEIGTRALETAAGLELARRQAAAAGALPATRGSPPPGGLTPEEAADLAAASGPRTVIDTTNAGAVVMASIQPELIEPVTGNALRNQDGARGIRRNLVSERADP